MKRPTYTITMGIQNTTTRAWNTALKAADAMIRAELSERETATRQPLQNVVKPDKWTTSAADVPYLTSTGRTLTVNITSDYETICNL